MKQLFLGITIVFFSLTAFSQLKKIPEQNIPPEYGYIVKPGQQLPEFEFTTTDGATIKTSDLKGKVVMLQFTASWCSVCRKEMPHIENEIWQKHRSNKKFALYGIDLDEPLDKVKKFGDDIKITYPLALDPGGKIFYSIAAKNAGVTRNIIVDKNGKIVYLTRLYNEKEFSEMKQVIELLLKE